MRLVVLGSGVLLPDARRGSASLWVESGSRRILLDCGAGAVHGTAREGLPWAGLTHVVLSHFHTDHTGALASLLWAFRHGAEREEPLRIVGPPGLSAHLGHLADAHGGFVSDPGFPVEIVEAEMEEGALEVGGLRLGHHPTPHTGTSLAWTLESEGARIGFTGDTGPSEELGAFLAGCDVLVSECSVADPTALDNHLSPSSCAALASRARPGLLLLTHLYPELDPARLPDLLRSAGYEGWTVTAWDGTVVDVAEERVRLLRAGSPLVPPPAPDPDPGRRGRSDSFNERPAR